MILSRRSILAGSIVSACTYKIHGTRSGLRELSVPADMTYVELNGFDHPGDAGRGAPYRRGDAQGLFAIQDRDGAWWNLDPGPVVWAGWFGALGSADDTLALQAAINWVS